MYKPDVSAYRKVFIIPGAIIAVLILWCDISQGQTNEADTAQVLYMLAKADTVSNEDYEITLLNRADSLAEDLDYARGMYKVDMAIGEYYHRRNNSAEALLHFQQANDIADWQNNKADMAAASNAMGGVYYNKADYSLALKYFREAEEQWRATGNENKLAVALNNIGEIYLLTGKYNEALEYFLKSVKISEKVGRQDWELANNQNIGMAYLYMGEYDDAIAYVKKSIKLAHVVNDTLMMAGAYYAMGEVYRSIKEYNNAGPYYDFAEQLQERLPVSTGKRDLMLAQSKLNKALGNYKKALAYHEQYVTIKDSIFNETKQLELLLAEQRIKEEKKNREIAEFKHQAEVSQMQVSTQKSKSLGYILAAAIFLGLSFIIFVLYRRQQANNRLLEQSVQEKEVLLKEVHHRVKNNFQVITSLLNLQTALFEDPKTKEAFNESKNRIAAMSLVHEQLYKNKQLSRLKMDSYLNDLTSTVVGTFDFKGEKHIKYKTNGQNLELDVDTAIPLGLIINELVTNACKYAFTEVKEGLIEVKLFNRPDGFFELTVRDNGKGLPEGFKMSKVDTLGLELVQILVGQLNGQFHWENDNGAVFQMIFEKR